MNFDEWKSTLQGFNELFYDWIKYISALILSLTIKDINSILGVLSLLLVCIYSFYKIKRERAELIRIYQQAYKELTTETEQQKKKENE